MRFFTSDLHFGHKNVIDFCKRPFADVAHMESELIRRWNSVVGADDKTYICGDLFFVGKTKSKEIMNQLHGEKILILGNHDWGKIKKHRAEEFGFVAILDTLCLRIGKEDVRLSHFPYSGAGDHTEGEERYTEHRLKDEGNWLIHGHVHSAWQVKHKMINVGVDVWDYFPVSEQLITALIWPKGD